MKVYKVCSIYAAKKGIVYKSALCHGCYTCAYEIGKVTVPRVGLLFAYKTYEDALKDNWEQRGDVIFECEAEIAKQQIEFRASTNDPERKYVKFWADIYNGKVDEQNIYPLKQGTVFCNWIKPLKIITYANI